LRVDNCELHISDWLFRQPASRKDPPRVRDLNVFDTDVAELAEPSFGRCHGRAERNPVRRNFCYSLRNGRVAITRIPVQSEGEGKRNILHLGVANKNVFDKTAARLRRLETNAFSRADALIVIRNHVTDAARSFASERKDTTAAPGDVVANDDVLRWAINA